MIFLFLKLYHLWHTDDSDSFRCKSKIYCHSAFVPAPNRDNSISIFRDIIKY